MSYERYIDWPDEAFDDYATAQDLYKLERYIAGFDFNPDKICIVIP